MKKQHIYPLALFCLLLASLSLSAQDYALLIAVDKYEHWPSLNNPIKDVKAIGKDLEEIYGFSVEILMNPSQREIFEKLREYQLKKYAENAQLFIFLSGHGEFFTHSREGFFIPRDGKKNDELGFSYIPHDRLESNIDPIPCRHILLAIDACYSGTFDKAIALMKGKDPFRRPGELPKEDRSRFIARSLRTKSRLYLTSGGKERTPDGVNHSPFVEKFLEGLRSYGGDDFILTYNELASYMEQAVPEPRFGQFGSHEISGKFLFIGRNDKYVNTGSQDKGQLSQHLTPSTHPASIQNAFYTNIQKLIDRGELDRAVKAVQTKPTNYNVDDVMSFYMARGMVFSKIAEHLLSGDNINVPNVKKPAVQAFDAYSNVLRENQRSIRIKKTFEDEALKGISRLQSYLDALGISDFKNQAYEDAYQNFYFGLRAHEILSEYGAESILDEPNAMLDQKYWLGWAAMQTDKIVEARVIFRELYNEGYENPSLYEALYNVASKGNNSNLDEAYQFLAEGRRKHPDNTSLLFAEINHLLKQNKLSELISKLELAIQKEPQNISLYTTLGSVYDNLMQKAREQSDFPLSGKYYDLALDYYEQALKLDPRRSDALYAIGALYYNKAAYLTLSLHELADDYSKTGIKKYEEVRAEVSAEFENALPYFQKAESVDPNNVNTLVALKEIYARKEDLATANEFQRRLEKIQGGGSNATSYFKL
ncbi:caspase family protein [Phaeodactylibacter xiamenensis]|uniref:caspase family protein n=1 Tax=Phaeodactylibacter xiamenensis TaxID=1524460 RepID=UPI0024A9E740|nr:caspase family protein [Phaeodactylibacter xiamenensis]